MFNVYYMFSETCGTGNIDENESELESVNLANVEIADNDGMEVDTESVSSDLIPIIEGSDDSRPGSALNSRPNSSLNFSSDSQEVRQFCVLFSNVKLIYLK